MTFCKLDETLAILCTNRASVYAVGVYLIDGEGVSVYVVSVHLIQSDSKGTSLSVGAWKDRYTTFL